MFRRFLMVMIGVGALVHAGAANAAEDFTDKQKTQIGEIVKQYLMDNPAVLMDAMQKYQDDKEKEMAAKGETYLKDNVAQLFENPDLPFMGNAKGKKVLLEFYDYNCGFCKAAYQALVKLIDQDKDLKIILLDTPILSPASQDAAKWSLAAQKQGKYAEMHQAIMEHGGPKTIEALTEIAKKLDLDVEKIKTDAATPEVSERIAKNMEVFSGLGLNGTPGFATRDQILRGFPGPEALEGILSGKKEGDGKAE